MAETADDEFRQAERRPATRVGRLRVALSVGVALAMAAVAALAVVLLSGEAERADHAVEAGTSQAGAAPAVALDNAVARQAGAWGVSTCLAEIATLSDFLTGDSAYASHSFRGSGEADSQLFSAAIAAREQASGLRSMSLMAVAPVSGGGCNRLYSTVVHFDLPCAQAQARHFPAFSETIDFGEIAAVHRTADGNSHAYMLPSAGGCTVMKTQVIY